MKIGRNVTISILIFSMVISGAFSANAESRSRDKSTVITTGIIGGSTLLIAGTFMFIRHYLKSNQNNDSIATAVETNFVKAKAKYADRDFLFSFNYYDTLLRSWDRYAKIRKGEARYQGLTKDSIVKYREYSRYLSRIEPQLKYASAASSKLPGNEEQLISRNRHEVRAIIDEYRLTYDSLCKAHPDLRMATDYGFEPYSISFDKVENMFRSVYEQERLNFNLKSRFFYNRVIESKDAKKIEEFVDDCSYYQSDKEWCEKARLALSGASGTEISFVKNEPNMNKGQKIKVSKNATDPDAPKAFRAVEKPGERRSVMQLPPKDPWVVDYRAAMDSRNIETLQAYLTKYSKSKYRLRPVKLDSVKTFIDTLLKVLALETAYNNAHPLLTNGSHTDFQFAVNGIDECQSGIAKSCFDSLYDHIKKVPSIRFPAGIKIDCSQEPPYILMNAFVNMEKDGTLDTASSTDTALFRFTGIKGVFDFLKIYKKELGTKFGSQPITVVSTADNKRIMTKINEAIYIIRLRKTATDYITFYAHDSEQGIVSYDFFDITCNGQKDVRIKSHQNYSICFPTKRSEDAIVKMIWNFIYQ